MKRKIVLTVLVVALAAALSATASSGSTEREMVLAADVIAFGQVVRSESVRRDRQVMTRVMVDVEGELKGSGRRQLEVMVPGGFDTSGKHPVAVVYPDAPRFGERQEVLLFLRRGVEGSSVHTLVGLSQGAFGVVRAADGRRFVTPDLHVRQVSPDTDGAVPLEVLVERLQGHMDDHQDGEE